MAVALHHSSPSTQIDEEAKVAQRSSEVLAKHLRKDKNLALRVAHGDHADEIVLPPKAAIRLMAILRSMARGDDLALTPIHGELTTRQAAEILNFSRPHLIKLLNAGEIPYHNVGSHRRLRREDVMRYKQKFDEERDAFLTWLVAESEELGLYD